MKRRAIGLALMAVMLIGVALFFSMRPQTTAPTSRVPQRSYIALGDSVAAGIGLPTASDSSACDRTDESYPIITARTNNYAVINMACSGATLPDGILGPQTVNRLALDAQLQQLFKQPRPSLISLTIGANDAGWTEFIRKCYTGQCGTASDTAALTQRLTEVQAQLQTALVQLRQQYGSSVPQVVLVGYYQVFPNNDQQCTDLVNIDSSERSWGRLMQANINDTLRSSIAGYDFVRFTTPDFAGHELCSADPWVQGLTSPQPYHPTTEGQQAIAQALLAAVQ